MQFLDALLRRWGINPGDIAGTSLAGEIPISDALINRLIAKRLERHAHIASVVVTSRDGDEALVRVEPRARLIPSVPIVVRIERQPDLPRDPTLRLRWSIPAAGPLALVAGAIAGYVKAMPEGVLVDRDVVVVDLRVLLRARGLEEVLDLVRRAAIHTRPGAMVVQLEAGLGLP
jgi:hypothetical protein